MSIDVDDGIIEGKCSCPRGLAICHHMAALCIYGHHNVSVTDKTCVWNKPSKPSEADTITKISDIYQPKRKIFTAVKRKATAMEITTFKNQLGTSNPVGFTWWLMPTPTEKNLQIPSIEDIIFSKEYANSSNKDIFFMDKCKVSQDTIVSVHKLTVGQGTNAYWLMARKYRITSSKFGAVLAACKRNKFPKSLFKGLMEGYDLSGVQAIQWGRDNEQSGIDTFQEITGLTVEPAGFLLDHCGFIGTSPDGYVSEKCLIEVKCPFKYRNVMNLKEALTNDKSYIIYYEGGKVVVNEHHIYYDQIQGELHITNKDMCYLVVWTPNDSIIKRISKNNEWKSNINVIKSFYLKHFLPHLYN